MYVAVFGYAFIWRGGCCGARAVSDRMGSCQVVGGRRICSSVLWALSTWSISCATTSRTTLFPCLFAGPVGRLTCRSDSQVTALPSVALVVCDRSFPCRVLALRVFVELDLLSGARYWSSAQYTSRIGGEKVTRRPTQCVEIHIVVR